MFDLPEAKRYVKLIAKFICIYLHFANNITAGYAAMRSNLPLRHDRPPQSTIQNFKMDTLTWQNC